MSKWWPFKKTAQIDEEALYHQAAADLQALYDSQRAENMSRQAILKYIEMESKMLEAQPESPELKAKLRANDGFYDQLKEGMKFNLTAGRKHEMANELDQAVAHYEMAVEDQVSTRFPYEHLRIIYRRNDYIEDALRICETAVANPFLNKDDHTHFQKWADRFTDHLKSSEN